MRQPKKSTTRQKENRKMKAATYKMGRDVNGNKIVRVNPENGFRGFSIQTNGNLVDTDRNGVCDSTGAEVNLWVNKYGTDLQRQALRLPARARPYYIQRREGSTLETVDQFDTRKEALEMVKEYRISDPSAEHYISRRACKNWND